MEASDVRGNRLWERLKGKPFALWVIFGALVYVGIAILASVLPLVIAVPAAAASPLFIAVIVFAVIFVLAAVAGLTGKRWGLVVSAVVSILFLALFGPFIIPELANPASSVFWLAMSAVPALLLATIFSILSIIQYKNGISTKRYLSSPQSVGGLFTIAVVGFVIGGLVVGSVASILIQNFLAGAGQAADVRIVPNAALGPSGGVPAPFNPAVFTIRANQSVTWINGDTTTHTVTSNVTGLFDSGNLAPGARYTQKFTSTGTFEYHCEPHQMTMWGKVVVT